MKTRNFVVYAILAFCLLIQQSAWADFDFDDLEQMEQSEQEELLEMAKQAAGNWNFSSARSYLSQAQEKGYSPDAIDSTKQVIANHRAAYEENERRIAEEKRREEEEERRRLAEAERQRQRQYSSSSGGSSPDYVMVTVDCISGFGCAADKLTLSGGTGNFSGSAGGSTVSIMKGYNGALGGRYSYTVRVQYKKYCSGSFNVSGNKANVYLSIYSDGCRIASVSEH